MNDKVAEAFEILKQAIKEDTEEGSLAHSWHCNIAMMCYDAMDAVPWTSQTREAHEARHKRANDAASRFMKMCFDAKTA